MCLAISLGDFNHQEGDPFDAGPLILLPLHLHWPSITPFWSSSLKARPWSCYHPELISFWNVKCNNPTLTATFGTWISLSITHCPLVHLVSWLLSSFDSPPSPHLLTCFPSEARPCPIIPIPPASKFSDPSVAHMCQKSNSESFNYSSPFFSDQSADTQCKS